MNRRRRCVMSSGLVAALAVAASVAGAGTAAATTNCDGLTTISFSPGLDLHADVVDRGLEHGLRAVRLVRPSGHHQRDGVGDPVDPDAQLPRPGGEHERHARLPLEHGRDEHRPVRRQLQLRAGVFALEQLGTVTSGVFAGQTSSATLALTGNILNCLTSGLTAITGPNVLVIT
jgi:hypothetical protein